MTTLSKVIRDTWKVLLSFFSFSPLTMIKCTCTYLLYKCKPQISNLSVVRVLAMLQLCGKSHYAHI